MVYCGILGICLPLARGMGRCAGKQHQEVLRTMQCTEKYFEADAFRTRAESVLLAVPAADSSRWKVRCSTRKAAVSLPTVAP